MSRRRLLLISYHFDPDDEIGGVRPRAYATHLPALGWDVLVVAAGDPADDTTSATSSVRHVTPETGAGKRTAGLPERRGIRTELAGLVPNKLGWGVRAGRRAAALGHGWKPDAVLSSAPSHVVNIAAWHAAGRLGVPWVAEFRDLWARKAFRTGTRLRRLPDTAAERLMLRRAAALVTVSEPLAEVLRRDYPRIRAFAIPTGIDEASVAPPGGPLDEMLTILYTGRIYSGRQDLGHVLRAIRACIDQGLIEPDRIRLQLVLLHPLADEDRGTIDRLGLRDLVDVEARMPREEAIDRQRRAQILLHLRWDDPGEPGITTGKIFEYLAARRPVLSTGRYRDVAVDLLESTRAGTATISEADTTACLGQAFAEWRETGRVTYGGDEVALRRLDLRGTAEAMGKVLETVVRGPSGSR